ncbi:hypothetical protein [Cellvibrio sp. PSBB023]|uniref:hypothetical protein n=1 Tax=Cellvibrio sp. PSBB023 TaxID=1945512 RepID=UPI00098EFDBA|nr:hypothetical protein [Cellvibrio sp. PSBB023]AQT59961.1 hypothetical protein B0D95_07585 [Cellvibrio sp. PSBB023]
MNGLFLDSAIKSIARYLVKLEKLVSSKYDGNVRIKEEIELLNQQYGFVDVEHVSAFVNDIYRMYEFERNRELTSIDSMAYAKFKWDLATGVNDLQRLKNELHQELAALNTP